MKNIYFISIYAPLDYQDQTDILPRCFWKSYNRNSVAGCGRNLVTGCANLLFGFGFEHINIM
jgi:hypothetical protein